MVFDRAIRAFEPYRARRQDARKGPQGYHPALMRVCGCPRHARIRDLEHAIATTPVQTLAGAAVQIRRLRTREDGQGEAVAQWTNWGRRRRTAAVGLAGVVADKGTQLSMKLVKGMYLQNARGLRHTR